MKKEIEQVTISMVVKGAIIDRLKKIGIEVLTENKQMVDASNKDAVDKKGEKFAARLKRADNTGRIIFDGGKLITPKIGIEFVSPSHTHADLTSLGFKMFDFYLKQKEGDTSGKCFMHIKYRRGESASKYPCPMSVTEKQLEAVHSMMKKTYMKMTGFHNSSRTYEIPPRWYPSEPENITLNFVGFAVTKADFAEENQHKFRIARLSDDNEYLSWPSAGLQQIASI